MRKCKGQQKNETSRQLKLFMWQAGELAGTSTGGTGTESLNRVELHSLLERQRTLTENLLERIVDYGNLMRTYKQVASNDGSGGIDGMETEELRQWLGKHINTLRESLLTEKYEVSAVLKVEILKPEGGKRVLGIPTVKDRVIQQAIHQELSHYYEPIFSESSYGFRPGRRAHQAIEQASKYIQEGKEWVVDVDLEKFFDKINHDRLMQRLSKGIGERVMTSIVYFIEKKLKLKVNNAKSGVRHCSDVKFLGYTLLPEGGIRVADKSIDRLKDRIREITRRNRGVKFEEVIRDLNATIIGWTNYFRLANIWLTTFRELDGWIRRKLRCYRLKQCGRRYTIFKLLRSLDIPEGKSWNVVMYSQGWWQMSMKVAVGQAMNLNWFA